MTSLRLKSMLFLRRFGPAIKRTPLLRKVVFSETSLRIIHKIFYSNKLIVVSVGDKKMQVRIAEHDTQFLVTGQYEPGMTKVFKNSVKSGMNVLDIGANIGYYTILSSSLVGPKGRVYAFEPEDKNYKILESNINLNNISNATLIKKAVSKKTGKIKLFIDPDPTSTGTHSTYPIPGMKQASVAINCLSIDNMFKNRRIDVVKIDTEGAEVDVLEGMKNTIKKNRKIKLFVELNFANLSRSDKSGEDLINILKGYGLRTFLIDEQNGRLFPFTQKLFNKHKSVWEGANLYCIV